jgi:hypothetical protein
LPGCGCRTVHDRFRGLTTRGHDLEVSTAPLSDGSLFDALSDTRTSTYGNIARRLQRPDEITGAVIGGYPDREIRHDTLVH